MNGLGTVLIITLLGMVFFPMDATAKWITAAVIVIVAWVLFFVGGQLHVAL